jgi:hypothetical protein
VNVDLVLDPLKGDWRAIIDAWSILAVATVVVGGVIWMFVRLTVGRQVVNLKRRLELRDSQLAGAKAKIAKDIQALEGERQIRQNLEARLASLREQLAIAQGQLMARRKPTPPRDSRHQPSYDELFGPGEAIDGKLTKGEAERLIEALQEIAGLMRSRLGLGPAAGPMQPHSSLGGSNGPAWWLYIAKKGIPHALELIVAYRTEVINFANSLEAAITRQPDLEFRLRKIVGNVGPVAGLLNIVGGYIRSMERLNDSETYKPVILEMALGGPFEMMVQAQIVVDNWMQLFVERRAPAVHREAVAYL